ncbi:MAG: hypothetical protein MRZ31_02030 [Dysosmobacter sp.]|uniref:hypothetical protein n=1 Tax=Dysosmobacter sp. TaxID=2591382 RepID=UPI002673F107|nr:hypothetical protein [Dysosmobacter sp.]MCI6015459.1 hypothetical protein [Dysosmobacter sp.]
MAVSKYDKENLSQKDQDRIAAVTAAAERGEMSWADAHNEAESIRSNAGYSGGRYGNEYNSNDRGSSSGSSGGSSGGSNQNNGLHFNGIDYTQTGGGIYGVPTINSDVKNYKQGGVTYQVGANMARRPDLAGKIAISNGYTVFYDDNGYATRAVKGVADYTPHLDINAGNGTYNSAGAWTDNEILTKNDKDTIDKYRKLASEGKMSWADANAKANAIRSGYGYTIDSKGNVTDLLAKSTVDARRQQWGLDTSSPSDAQQNFLNLWNGGSSGGQSIDMDSILSMFGQGNFGGGGSAPEWQGSQWDDLLNQVANELATMNYEDWTKGDQYKALAERYGNQGRMSMQDVLGQISSRTGGLASSYAATAAQQEYNQFMSQLEDVARQMYSSDRSDLLDKANMYRQLGQDDYDKYLDDLGQWNTDRNFQYGAYRDSVEDQRYADETAWEREKYGNTQSENQKSAAQDRIAAYLAAGGKIADLDQDLIAASGLTTSELSAQEKYYTQQAAKKSTGSSSGSSKPRLTAAQTVEALEKGIVNDSTLAAYEYYFGQPYDDGSENKSTKKSFVNGSGVTATPLDYDTIKKNSEAGNYGRKYGMVLGEIQAKFAKGADAGTLADIIDKALKNGDINEAGADTLLRALGY